MSHVQGQGQGVPMSAVRGSGPGPGGGPMSDVQWGTLHSEVQQFIFGNGHMGLPPPIDLQTRLKTLASSNSVGGW